MKIRENQGNPWKSMKIMQYLGKTWKTPKDKMSFPGGLGLSQAFSWASRRPPPEGRHIKAKVATLTWASWDR